MNHIIDNGLLTRKVMVALVGCGGVGSQALSDLARLHMAMVALGHAGGLHVTAFDDDTVSKSNVGRQLFYQSDVGQFKSTVLIHRLNMAYGLNWTSAPERFGNERGYRTNYYDIIVSCVDTKQSRRDLAIHCHNNQCSYWLDMGNNLSDGQVILGQPSYKHDQRDKALRKNDLPTVTVLYPEILDESIPEDNNTPSCSLAEALEHQDLFIGKSLATFGIQLLWNLFRNGGLDHHGYFVNLKAGMVTPLPVNPDVWKAMIPKKARKPRAKSIKTA